MVTLQLRGACQNLWTSLPERLADMLEDRIRAQIERALGRSLQDDELVAAAAPGTIALDVANDRFYLRTGGTGSVPVTISRGAGENGDVVVKVHAPPNGVTFDPLTIGSGANAGTLAMHGAVESPYGRF